MSIDGIVKTVVIIKGNPDRVIAGNLYANLEKFMRKRGYHVFFDEGLPFTIPDVSADVWIGHSRGADRLRFAPEGIIRIAMGSKLNGSINHPDDIVDLDKDEYDHLPNAVKIAHNSWHSSFDHKLDNILRYRRNDHEIIVEH
jgi:hypothetical protein